MSNKANFSIYRRWRIFLWFKEKLCCQKDEISSEQFKNGGRTRGGGVEARDLHQNYNSMRTFTTSLTVTSQRRSNPHRVVIVEQENIFLAKNEVKTGVTLLEDIEPIFS